MTNKLGSSNPNRIPKKTTHSKAQRLLAKSYSDKIKIITITNIGKIHFKKSKKAKRLSISITDLSIINVSVPLYISFDIAEEFVYTKLSWITKNLKILKNKTKLNNTDKELARDILSKRLDYLCEKYNFSYNKLSIRNQKTRWGSCSSKNNISLNAKLIHLPKKLIDYVILHELVHTNIKNHSKEFWDTLDLYISNSKSIGEKLKRYSL